MTEPNPPRVRASDEERERVAEALRAGMGEGRLTLAEGEERLTGVYAATYRDELPGFTADLPADPPRSGRDRDEDQGRDQGRGRGWGGCGGWGRDGRRRAGLRPLIPVAVLVVLASAWVLSSGRLAGPLIVAGIAALVLLKHGAYRRWHHHPTR